MKLVGFVVIFLISGAARACFRLDSLKALFGYEDQGHNTALATFTEDPIKGHVFFKTEDDGLTTVAGLIIGFEPDSFHAIHVHEFGDLSLGCDSVGHHFNPTNEYHGGKYSKERHMGDLGNHLANARGEIQFRLKGVRISVKGHSHNILGRALVIHETGDDLGYGKNTKSLTGDNAGKIIACALIGIFNPDTHQHSYPSRDLLVDYSVIKT
ncbi:Superoxide dismutase [Cu-Zn] [Cichlidogyrus casuarinus]|uniref:Superoxide dismutase [Cu-Zn] n=1 Tax=Cichlidogyrus casuarinus TaxID=1844966 RepID=A0ABD2QJJ5_9PLAT